MKTLIIVVATFFTTLCYGQTEKKIDSLEKSLKTKTYPLEKIEVLESLYTTLLYENPKSSLKYSLKAYQISKSISNNKKMLNAAYQSGVSYRIIHKLDSAVYYHRIAMSLAKELNEDIFYAKALSELADIERLNSNKEEALLFFNEAKEIYKKNNEIELLSSCIGNIASVYLSNGQFRISQKLYMQALKTLDSIDADPVFKADMIARIGEIQHNVQNYEEAIDYYKQALKVYTEENDNVWKCNMYLQIGTSYVMLKNYDSAIENFSESLKIAKEYSLKSNEAMLYTNIGALYRETKEFEKSKVYLEESLVFHKREGFTFNYIDVLKELGSLYIDLDEPNKALEYLDLAITKSIPSKRLDYLMDLYKLRSLAYEELNNTNMAIKDLKEHQKFKDSIYNSNKNQQIEELQTIYETDKKQTLLALNEEEIKNLHQKSKVDTLTKSLYAGGMFSGVSLSIMLFFIFKQRIKKNKSNQKKQNELHKKEIEHKQKELTSLTVHLVQKNTFTQELIENLKKLKNNPEKFNVEFRRILMLLKKQTADDKDWDLFKSYFADVHNNFDNKLRDIYADITEKEIRLAAFLRMNLSTKEIAAIFNVLPDSILKSKYRLKKKLNLGKQTDLCDFLNSL